MLKVLRKGKGINITTKEYLKQAFKLDAQINCLIREVESIEARATK